MTTRKPKLQGYIDSNLFDSYQQWKIDHDLKSDSLALNQILSEYLNLPQIPAKSAARSASTSSVEQRLESLEDQLHNLISQLSEGNGINNQLAMLSTSTKAGTRKSAKAPKAAKNTDSETQPKAIKSKKSQVSPTLANGLTQNQLAERLQTTYKTVWKHRQRGNEHFAQWTQEQDPEQIAWDYGTREKGKGNQVFFRPL